MFADALRALSIALSLTLLVPLTIMYGINLFYRQPVLIIKNNASYSAAQMAYEEAKKEYYQVFQEHQLLIDKKIKEYEQQISDQKLVMLKNKLEEKKSLVESLYEPIQADYDKEQEHHSSISSLFASFLGIACSMVGLLIPVSSIGAGMVCGGTATIIFALIAHSDLFDNTTIFFTLILAILSIILVSYFVFRKNK